MLSSGAEPGGANSLDLADAWRLNDRGDREIIPRIRTNDCPANRPGQAQDYRGPNPVRSAAGGADPDPARICAGCDLSDFQRRLCSHIGRSPDSKGAVSGGDPPGARTLSASPGGT